MKQTTQYTDLIQEAANALRDQVRMGKAPIVREYAGEDEAFDAVLEVVWNDQRQEYLVEVKPTLNQAMLGQIANKFRQAQGQPLVITQAVLPHLAKKMRDLEIQFLDTAGNVYLNTPDAFLFIHGHKRPDLDVVKTKKGVFTPAGTKVIFALLCRLDLVNATYRDVAQTAGVALETMNRVFKGLQRQGYLIDLGTKGRRLRNHRQLLERWVIAYAEQLRPKQLIGTYHAGQEIDWKVTELPAGRNLWGAEAAAAKLTHYLTPEILTIYTHRPAHELLQRFRLAKHPEGKIELREIFWDFTLETPVPALVPPLLIYADLMATADPRNIETAKLVYDEYLQRHLQED